MEGLMEILDYAKKSLYDLLRTPKKEKSENMSDDKKRKKKSKLKYFAGINKAADVDINE